MPSAFPGSPRDRLPGMPGSSPGSQHGRPWSEPVPAPGSPDRRVDTGRWQSARRSRDRSVLAQALNLASPIGEEGLRGAPAYPGYFAPSHTSRLPSTVMSGMPRWRDCAIRTLPPTVSITLIHRSPSYLNDTVLHPADPHSPGD
jgi:hypothetical protein